MNIKSSIKVLNIKDIYEKADNKCEIIVYHGNNDNLINVKEKYEAVKNIPNTVFNLITSNDIDNDIFKSTNHGLGADFIKLFDKFHKDYCNYIPVNNQFNINNKISILDEFKVDYSSGSNLRTVVLYKFKLNHNIH